MGVSGQSITLANSIIGVGILAMPFCFQQVCLFLNNFIINYIKYKGKRDFLDHKASSRVPHESFVV